mmetsp:Transcript_21523/g.87809  ORF Transcript_21523/g.87809 Transcript_21523/m.87809 type:complete len:134 (+) Transcript_21523:334-735(+)
MAGRVLAQLILAGGTFMVRTFAQAYRQALVNAQTGGGAAASASRGVVGRNQMTVDEASRILGLEKNTLKLASLEAKYQKLYEQNSVEKGGSPYLQYKIVGAKEVLERECIARGEKPPNQESAEKKGTEKIDGQ